ncbi:hypothetical protein SD81_034560 [Tolypothrix campylonemoides VB511288]|nr:hypothetical protein SD81_034560 [Tolypothrix campylonemoides VB511288]
MIFSSKDIPGIIPDPLVIHERVLNERPEAVQVLMNTWYQTLEYRAAHLNEVLAIEAKQAGVSLEEYNTILKGFKWITPEECLNSHLAPRKFDIIKSLSIKPKALYLARKANKNNVAFSRIFLVPTNLYG